MVAYDEIWAILIPTIEKDEYGAMAHVCWTFMRSLNGGCELIRYVCCKKWNLAE